MDQMQDMALVQDMVLVQDMALVQDITEALGTGSRYLTRHSVDDPRTEAGLLLAFALGESREFIFLQPDFCLTSEQKMNYQRALEQRARRVPYAYIVGSREFMGLSFAVNEAVLIPRPETETLVETVLAQRHLLVASKGESPEAEVSLLDLCTGSGAVALALARHWPELTSIMGTDISPEALKVACRNARSLGVAADWQQGDLWDAVGDKVFTCITANPPYLADKEYRGCHPEVHCEPEMALWGGTDGLDFYRRIAAGAAARLKTDGRVYLEIGWLQAEAVCKLMEQAGFVTEVFADLAGRDRVVAAWQGK